MSNSRCLSFVIFAFSLFLIPNAKDAAAAVIYEQAPVGTTNTPGVISGANSGTLVQSFDDFMLPTAATVGTVRWIGDIRPADSEFRIEFFENNDTAPFGLQPLDTPFFSTVVAADVTPDSDFSHIGAFSADLGSRVSFDASTRYWISILGPGQFGWGWNGDNVDIALTKVFSSFNFQQFNLFFTLDSDGGVTEVPAPAGLPLFAVGVVGLFLSRRRWYA